MVTKRHLTNRPRRTQKSDWDFTVFDTRCAPGQGPSLKQWIQITAICVPAIILAVIVCNAISV